MKFNPKKLVSLFLKSRTFHFISIIFLGSTLFLSLLFYLCYPVKCSDCKIVEEYQLLYAKDLNESRATHGRNYFPVHLISTGDYNQYNLKNLRNWLYLADRKSSINIIRDQSWILTDLLSDKEKEVLDKLKVIPVSQADFMKYLLMKYFAGVVADFDIEPLKNFPAQWMYTEDTVHCNVFLGQEHDCFEGKCLNRICRPGQIQTWALFARNPGSDIIDRIIQYGAMRLHNDVSTSSIQDIFGSGMLTDFVNNELFNGKPYYDIPLQEPFSRSTIRYNTKGILYYPPLYSNNGSFIVHHDRLCILGLDYTGWSCSWGYSRCLIKHGFEGTWKH